LAKMERRPRRTYPCGIHPLRGNRVPASVSIAGLVQSRSPELLVPNQCCDDRIAISSRPDVTVKMCASANDRIPPIDTQAHKMPRVVPCRPRLINWISQISALPDFIHPPKELPLRAIGWPAGDELMPRVSDVD